MERECVCGPPDCPRRISGHDLRLPELQRRYAGHFLPLIAKRIGMLMIRLTLTVRRVSLLAFQDSEQPTASYGCVRAVAVG